MPLTKKLTADLLFAVQIGWPSFPGQRIPAAAHHLPGRESHLAGQLAGLPGHQPDPHHPGPPSQPSRVTWQTVLGYAAWTTMIAACLGAMLWRGTGLWDAKDTLTAIIVGLGL